MPHDSERPSATDHTSSEVTPLEQEAIRFIDKKYARKRRRRLIAKTAFTLGAALSSTAYWSNVHANMERQELAEPSVSVYDEALHTEDTTSALVFFNGFGTYDADPIADVFGPGLKKSIDGESWSVSYGNAPLDAEVLADKIATLAEERDVNTIDIVGYSAGGSIGIETAAFLAENPDITIRTITAVSTPDGIDGLRPYQKQELDFAHTFTKIPGAKYSDFVRLGGEIYFMRNRFDEGSLFKRVHDFGSTAATAFHRLQQPKLPGTWLLVDQTLAIADADIKENLTKIAAEYEDLKPLPSIQYLGTAAPGRDYMVNNELSSHRICGYAYENSMNCTIHNVPSAVHTMPHKTADAYTTTFTLASEGLVTNILAAKEAFVAEHPNTDYAALQAEEDQIENAG